ncbi:MAG: hypothetical protein ACE5JU_13370 [Candidatus Binatia bacterium]
MAGKKKWISRVRPEAVFCATLSTLLFLPAYALSQAPFYQGKTLTIIQGRRPGGTGDMRTRSVISHLSKYIPGNPSLVTQYMPGGGGRKAANHIYNKARPDGLSIANIGAGFIANAVLGAPGVKYDIGKIIYLGSGNSRSSYVFITRKEAGLDSLEKLRAASGIRIGAQSVGHIVHYTARLFAWLLDLKEPKFVTGYSGREVDLAVLRGEVDARANISYTILQRSPEWIEKGLVHFHSIVEIPKGFRPRHPVFKRLPSLETFAKTDRERKVLEMYRITRLTGSPYIIPPGTPKKRVRILQEAFRKLFKDPEFSKTWRKLTGEEASPLLPEEIERALREIPRDPEVIRVFKKIAGAGPLPPR